jgi:hypothetical protein
MYSVPAVAHLVRPGLSPQEGLRLWAARQATNGNSSNEGTRHQLISVDISGALARPRAEHERLSFDRANQANQTGGYERNAYPERSRGLDAIRFTYRFQGRQKREHEEIIRVHRM